MRRAFIKIIPSSFPFRIHSCLQRKKSSYSHHELELEQIVRRQMGRRLERTHCRKSECRHYANQGGQNYQNCRLLRYGTRCPYIERTFRRVRPGSQDTGLGSGAKQGAAPSPENQGFPAHHGTNGCRKAESPATAVSQTPHPERPGGNGLRHRRPCHHIRLPALHLRLCQVPQGNGTGA